MTDSRKITAERRTRRAIVYLRQSSERQVRHNQESQRLQYALADRARDLGWSQVEVIDTDLGSSAALGAGPREGFQRLLAAVALGDVGIVLSREASRLSRTDKDWCHLLEICQLFDTLLADAERVYDLSLADDQLVLGIKGTLSVVELKTLRMRLYQGMEEKARRGELIRLLPAGYVCDALGKVVKDPDERVREAIASVFRKFRELWSIRQTYLWFQQHGIELPVNQVRAGKHQIVFKLPTHSFVAQVLRNPFYAGAYVYGRRPREVVLVEGRPVRRQGRERAPEEARVFIRDHHEGYIDWETYEENRRMVGRNSLRGSTEEAVGAVRSGHGLLAGLLRCRRCGRKLHVRYWGRGGTAARYLCVGDFDAGGRYCLGFGGSTVDRRFAEELLRVLSPLGVEASLQALEELPSVRDEQSEALGCQLRQLQYETERAGVQYHEVDPRNRLVAAELERRWNTKLEEVGALEDRLLELQGAAKPLADEDRERILGLGRRFDEVWQSKACPMELKKKIVRTVIEEVLVDLEEDTGLLSFTIHWKGGTHTQFQMDKPSSPVGRKTAVEDLELIRRMAVRYGDDEIARVLNKLGRRTGKGKRWTEDRVQTARRNHSISGQRRRQPDPEILTLGGAAKHCGVSDTTLRKLVDAGLVHVEQIVPWAPWEIRRSELETEPVHSLLERLRETGRLDLEGVRSDGQPTLFE
ncbi:MAG: recombinase family protein [Myxococcota bacterium]